MEAAFGVIPLTRMALIVGGRPNVTNVRSPEEDENP
jgi:hypothetical protein